MQVPARIVALTASLVAAGAAPADAADFCVAPATREGCIEKASLDAALDAANADAAPDRIYVGALDEQASAGPFADEPGRPVRIYGAGAAQTKLTATGGPVLRLSDADSSARWLSLTRATGGGGRAAELMAGAELLDSVVLGGVAAIPGGTGEQEARALRLVVISDGVPALAADRARLLAESVDAAVTGAAPGLRAVCSAEADARLVGRHLTVTGTMEAAGVSQCDGSRRADLVLENSVLAGTYTGDGGPFVAGGSASALTSAWSLHAADADVAASDALPTATDPGFISSTDRRLRPDSALVDAGNPAPLAAGEGLTDAAGLVRVVDGSGDATVRRDVGAHELQPAPAALPADNVLANPGAETAEPLAGWSPTSGSFEVVRFGADDFFPTRAAGAALGAGERFFAGGGAAESTLMQRVDVAASAASIDAGGASATLSGLLGGYGADADEVRVEAIFRDPAGEPVGTLLLSGPTPAERGNATNLLARTATGAIPPRTRAVDVVIRARRVAGSYTDGYADNVSLTLSVPGVSVPGPVDPAKPVVRDLKPFAGVTVLTGRPPMSPKGAVRVELACESSTVGRCSGRIELRAVPRGRKTAVRIARYGPFSVRPGGRQIVTVKLLLARRRAFLRHRSFRATLLVVARDGQGLERRKTVPVRVAKRSARRSARAR